MDAIFRQPLAFVGALGLISLASNSLQLQQNVADWLAAWQAVARPAADFAFGWFFRAIDRELTDGWKDYAVAGVIFAGMVFRCALFPEPNSALKPHERILDGIRDSFLLGLMWPMSLYIAVVCTIIFRLRIVKVNADEQAFDGSVADNLFGNYSPENAPAGFWRPSQLRPERGV